MSDQPAAPPAGATPLSREVLLAASKEELVDLLLLAIQGQTKATENMQQMHLLVVESQTKVKELEDKLATQESELIVLRNRP